MKYSLIFINSEEREEKLCCITTREKLKEFTEQLEASGCRFSNKHTAAKFTVKIFAEIQKLSYDRQGSSHVKNRQNKILLKLKDNFKRKIILVDLSCSYFDYSPNL